MLRGALGDPARLCQSAKTDRTVEPFFAATRPSRRPVMSASRSLLAALRSFASRAFIRHEPVTGQR